MAFHVTTTASAEADMDLIVAWLVKQSPAGAQSWLAALEDSLSMLEHSGDKFSQVSEYAAFGPHVHEHFFATPKGQRYRLVYELIGNRVNILRIRAPGQRPLGS